MERSKKIFCVNGDKSIMEIHFEIGDRCLLKCRHCSSMASEYGDKMKYSEQHMIELLNSIKERKEVFLTGGEPLLYTNLEGLLKNLKTEITNIELGLFTTGIIAKESGYKRAISEGDAQNLARCGLKVCYVSVYSHLEKEHDWMTKSPGSFRMLNESIEHLQAAGIEIRFNSVVTKRNMGFFEEIIKFAERLGVTEVRILKLIRQGRANGCWNEIGTTENQYRNVISNVIKRKNKLRITASGAIDILPCRCGCDEAICPAGKNLIYVTNNGDIFPCASVKKKDEYKIANISERDVNKKRQLFQEKVDGKMLCLYVHEAPDPKAVNAI